MGCDKIINQPFCLLAYYNLFLVCYPILGLAEPEQNTCHEKKNLLPLLSNLTQGSLQYRVLFRLQLVLLKKGDFSESNPILKIRFGKLIHL